MKIGIATFEYLPIRVGGLAEAVTSIGEALLSLGHEVKVYMPSHNLHNITKEIRFEKVAEFEIHLKLEKEQVNVFRGERGGVVMVLLSSSTLDHPQVYDDMLPDKVVAYAKALVGYLNLETQKDNGMIEILHAHDWHTALAALMAKRFFNLPFVFTIHRIVGTLFSHEDFRDNGLEFLLDSLNNNHDRFLSLEELACSEARVVTTVSLSYLEETWDKFFGNFVGKTTYVWNGIDVGFWDIGLTRDPELPRSERKGELLKSYGLENGYLFFFVGRFDIEQKGVDVMFSSIKQFMYGTILGAEVFIPKTRFLIVGSGDKGLEEEAQKLASEFPKNVKVIVGYLKREETRECYGSADFILIPSNFEPFGLVPLEAMSMSCIPIATRVGGMRDTILDLDTYGPTATGILAPPKDPTVLAQAMVKALDIHRNDDQLLRKLRVNGVKRVKQDFTWAKAALRYLRAYRGEISKKIPFSFYSKPY